MSGSRIGRKLLANAPGGGSIVAVDAFHALVAFLRLDAHRRDRAGLKPAQADRLAAFLTVAVGAGLDAVDRLVDLADQLARPVAGAKFQRPVGLDAGAVGEVRFGDAALGQGGKRLAGLAQQVLPPAASASAGNTPAEAGS